MGNYLNQDGKKFYEITHSDIYVDKTELLTYTNSVLQTLPKYICISPLLKKTKTRQHDCCLLQPWL